MDLIDEYKAAERADYVTYGGSRGGGSGGSGGAGASSGDMRMSMPPGGEPRVPA